MKGNKILGIIWIVIAVILGAFLIYGLTSTKWRNKGNMKIDFNNSISYGLYDSKSFSAEEINNFDIELKSEEVIVEKSSDNKITVELYCDENTAPKFETVQNTLKITEPSFSIGIKFGSRKVIIKIPVNCKISNFNFYVASGSVSISDLKAEAVDLKVSSGSIKIKDADFNKLDVDVKSGSIKIEESEIKNLNCRSASGSMKIDGTYDQIDLYGISGSITLDLKKPLTGASSVHTTSGSIKMYLPSESNLDIKYSITSGHYENDFTKAKGKKGTDKMGSGAIPLELKSTSGSIRIE